jgi:hypothetical protein
LGPDPALNPARDHYRFLLCPSNESTPTLPPASSLASLTLPQHQDATAALFAASNWRNRARLQSLTLSHTHACSLLYPAKPPYSSSQPSSAKLPDTALELLTTMKSRLAQFVGNAGGRKILRTWVLYLGSCSPMPRWRLSTPPPWTPQGGSLRGSGGYGPQLEPPHFILGRLTRPGDVYVPFGNNGLGSAYDVTLCPRYWGPSWPLPHVPLVTSSPPSSVKLPSTPAFVLRWTFACPTCSIDFWSVVWHLVPPDFSHCGPPSGSHWSTQWVALFRALFVATQRSIARDILDRASRLPEHAPLLSPCPS